MLVPTVFSLRSVGTGSFVAIFVLAFGTTFAGEVSSPADRVADETSGDSLTESLSVELIQRADWKAAANAYFDVADSTLQRLTVPVGRPDSFRTVVQIEQQPVTIRLEKHSIRSNDFQVLIQADASGQLVSVDPPPVSTYQGFIDNMPTAVVRASLIEGKFNAVVFTGTESYGIESISHAVPEADTDAYLVHRGSDALNSRAGSCGVSEHALRDRQFFDPNQPSAAGTGLEVTDIGIDADHSFFLLNGSSVTNTVVDVERVMNGFTTALTSAVANPYEVLGITYEITTIIVRTNVVDPYTSSDPDILLDQFRDTWRTSPESSIRRDVAHLFTGINIDAPTIGIAAVASVCQSFNGFHYGLSESRWSASTINRIALTAHELGHSFGAGHCNATASCRIMCSGLGGCTGLSPFTFGPSASAQISGFASGLGCLSPLPPPETLPFFDDFPTSALNSNRWTYVDGVFGSTTSVNPPSGTRAMNLDATGAGDFQENEARTNFINLNGAADGTVSYFTQHIGVESGESLIVDYWSVVGTTRRWIELNEVISDGVNQTSFTFHTHLLPSGALHSRFRLRFRTNVDGTNDDWYVDDVSVSTDVPPTIVGQPASVGACVGEMVAIEVMAVGTPSLTYQWFKDAVPLAGELNPILTIASASFSDSGDYTCRVSNIEGNVLSDPATLSVFDNASCDDGLFCNGVETCSAGLCVGSGDPCTNPAFAICNDTADTCEQTPRLFFVPAGTNPLLATPGQPFDAVAVGGTSIVVEAFLESDFARIASYAVAMDCTSSSSDVGAPDISYVADSSSVDSLRLDFAYPGLSVFPAIDPGQCDDAISCTTFADCPVGNSDCIDTDMNGTPDTCSVILPRVASVLLDPNSAPPFPAPRYLGDFEFQVPSAASGQYIVEPTCLRDSGCAMVLTELNGDMLPLNFDGLRLSIPIGRCCFDDDGQPPLGCSITTAFDCFNTFGGAFSGGDNCDGADPCACTMDCECVVVLDPGVTAGSDVCQHQSCSGGGCSEFATRYGDVEQPFGSFVSTGDISCGVQAFGNYCQCPNADIAGCVVSGIPIGTDDILAIVDAFGGTDPCGCPTAPAAASGDAVTFSAPIRFFGDSPEAVIEIVADRRSARSGETIRVDVHANGVDGLAGYEVALDFAIVSKDARVALGVTPVVDTMTGEFVFSSGEYVPLVDDELDRLGAVAVGYRTSVPDTRRVYLGTFEIDLPDDARGQLIVSPRPGGISMWRSSIEMIPVSEVMPVAVTVYSAAGRK